MENDNCNYDNIYDDPETILLDFNNRYENEETNDEVVNFYINFDKTFKDTLDDIRDRCGKDQEIAIDIFADELLNSYHANLKDKNDIISFIHTQI